MKKILVAILVALPYLLSASPASAVYRIKGQAIDSVSNETLPYVTCAVVMKKNPQQVVTRFASDVNGQFSGDLKAPGDYVIIISCMGQTPAQKAFSVNAGNPVANLGKVFLSSDKKMLKEVSVVASRPIVKVEADKITYDAQQDPESKSSNVLDLLRKVPMVTVDGQDNIQLQGSSNFKFFLNGKPTHMFDNNAGQILKSIPSNVVKTVEVITQPGAKYDAEGVGGIINIVTVQKSSTDGYSATVNGQVSSRGSYGGGLNLMIQRGKFSFSGNYNYNYNKQFPVTTTSDRQTNIAGVQYANAHQEATVNNTTPMQFGSGQLSFEPDTTNLFTLSFDRRYGRPNSITNALTQDYNSGMNEIFGYSQYSTQNQTWGSTDAGLDYQHSFKKKNETLTVSYKLSDTPNSSDYEATNTIDPLYVASPQPGLAQWTKSMNTASTLEHTFQADYSDPLAKGHTLEMGAKYIVRLNDSKTNENYQYFNFTQPYPFTPYVVADSLSLFNNNQNILAGYVSYTGNVGKWGLKAGLRYEYTWVNALFNDQVKNFSTSYGVPVPSALLTYRLTDMQTFKLGYDMRIQRPGIDYLNPYVDRRDPNYISYGNPALDAEKNHNITFGYSNFSATYNLSAELSYMFVNNAIEQYSFIPAGSTIQNITYGNIGHNQQYGLNLFGNYRGLPWLNLYLNSNVSYVQMSSSTYNFSNSGFTGRMFLGGTFMLPKDFRISTGGGGMLPRVNLQGGQSDFYFSYMALSKDFLNKKLTVSMSGVYLPKSHIIITTNGMVNSSGVPTFTQRTDVHLMNTAELRLNISYRIGNLNGNIKKPKTTISNDDEKQKDNSSLGQSPM